MDGETVLSAVRKPPRRDSGYWFDVLFGRLVPALIFSVFLAGKALLAFDAVAALGRDGLRAISLLYLLTQLLGLAYFTLLVVLYVVRLPKRAGDGRPQTIFASFFGTFAILLVTQLPGVPLRHDLLPASDALVLLGLAYTVWSLSYLRRSFSILPEARRLVTDGPYALSRHPLYLGEAVAGIGLTLPTVGWPGAILIGLFLLAQYVRIRAEEAVLARQFPEGYASYRRRVPRYLPSPYRIARNRGR